MARAYQTRQREKILQVLRQNGDRHITADALIEELHRQGETVGKATVYRYLDKLTQKDVVRRYTGDPGESACFQYVEGNGCHEHFHLKCETCGAVVHLECEHLSALGAHLAREHSCEINPFKTVLYGRCPVCVAKEEKQ